MSPAAKKKTGIVFLVAALSLFLLILFGGGWQCEPSQFFKRPVQCYDRVDGWPFQLTGLFTIFGAALLWEGRKSKRKSE